MATIVLFMMLAASSCKNFYNPCWVIKFAPTEVRRSLEYCYNGLPTGLDTIIPIHGYYTMSYEQGRWDYELNRPYKDTIYEKFMFYPNGFFTLNYGHGGEDRVGNYVVIGDVIKAYYYPAPCQSTWGGSAKWFQINKNKSLTYICFSPMKNRKRRGRCIYDAPSREYTDAVFEYSKLIPDCSNNWILKAKWFCCK